MIMRSFIFSLLLLISVRAGAVSVMYSGTAETGIDSTMVVESVIPNDTATGQALTSYDRRVHRYRRHWQSLIPTQSVIQFAGNMGLISVGVGWDYGKHKQWETHLLFGVLPRYGSKRTKVTMTLKENFIPWSLYIKNGWAVEPLSVGLYEFNIDMQYNADYPTLFAGLFISVIPILAVFILFADMVELGEFAHGMVRSCHPNRFLVFVNGDFRRC